MTEKTVERPVDEIDVRWIEALARSLDGSPVTELVVSDQRTEVRLSRTPGFEAPEEMTEAAGLEAGNSASEHQIRAKRVGIFHKAPKVVQVGDTVEAGQVIGFIEAMRLMNEIVADRTGVVTQVYVEDGAPVDYGHELLALVETLDDT